MEAGVLDLVVCVVDGLGEFHRLPGGKTFIEPRSAELLHIDHHFPVAKGGGNNLDKRGPTAPLQVGFDREPRC